MHVKQYAVVNIWFKLQVSTVPKGKINMGCSIRGRCVRYSLRRHQKMAKQLIQSQNIHRVKAERQNKSVVFRVLLTGKRSCVKTVETRVDKLQSNLKTRPEHSDFKQYGIKVTLLPKNDLFKSSELAFELLQYDRSCPWTATFTILL